MPALAYRTKLPRPDDPDILDTIREEVAKGTPLRHAAVLAGIHENTAYRWGTWGREALENAQDGQSLEELGSHAVFVWNLKEAQAEFVSEALDNWRGSEAKEFAIWATLLERREPGDFGRSDKRQVEQRTVSISVTAQLSGDQAEALLRVLSRQDTPLLASGDET